MTQHLKTAFLMMVVTTVLLGLVYPLVITGLAQVLFPDRANGQLIERDGNVIGSRIIGQPFTSQGYFYSRPSAAGAGYDAGASSGSNLGATNKKLIDRVAADVARLQKDNPGVPIPIDLVTSSGSGLDPHISPAAALFQVPRVARERKALGGRGSRAGRRAYRGPSARLPRRTGRERPAPQPGARRACAAPQLGPP